MQQLCHAVCIIGWGLQALLLDPTQLQLVYVTADLREGSIHITHFKMSTTRLMPLAGNCVLQARPDRLVVHA